MLLRYLDCRKSMEGFNFTSEPARLALLFAASYLTGSVNLTIVGSHLLKVKDPRETGSGNAGATNLLRSAGPLAATPILLLDFGKAYGIIALAHVVLANPLWAAAMIIPLLVGNIYPVFHRFRGGKGVAAFVGAMLAISPIVAVLAGIVFPLTLALFRRVSAASLAMVLSHVPLFVLLGDPKTLWFVSALAALIILYTHRTNIRRLFHGEEPPIFKDARKN